MGCWNARHCGVHQGKAVLGLGTVEPVPLAVPWEVRKGGVVAGQQASSAATLRTAQMC